MPLIKPKMDKIALGNKMEQITLGNINALK